MGLLGIFASGFAQANTYETPTQNLSGLSLYNENGVNVGLMNSTLFGTGLSASAIWGNQNLAFGIL